VYDANKIARKRRLLEKVKSGLTQIKKPLQIKVRL